MPLEVLALIPARAGSKGLPGKNVRRAGGATLLARAVRLALRSRARGERWSVVVSTDSPRYAAVARAAGAETPFIRPAALAADEAPLSGAVLHALRALADSGRRFDLVVMLSPTTPLTTSADVRAAVDLWRRHPRGAVVSVVPERAAPSWRFALSAGRLMAPPGRRVGRRQEAEASYVLNGAVYVATPASLERHGQFFAAGRTYALVMPPHRSLDIETAHDLRVARLLLGDGRSRDRRPGKQSGWVGSRRRSSPQRGI